jgi:hypothetical protein
MQTNVLQGMRAMLQRLHQQRRETQMLEAHYTTGKQPTLAFALTINGYRNWLDTIAVAGKREARKLAVARGATPWNF